MVFSFFSLCRHIRLFFFFALFFYISARPFLNCASGQKMISCVRSTAQTFGRFVFQIVFRRFPIMYGLTGVSCGTFKTVFRFGWSGIRYRWIFYSPSSLVIRPVFLAVPKIPEGFSLCAYSKHSGERFIRSIGILKGNGDRSLPALPHNDWKSPPKRYIVYTYVLYVLRA